jgi:hypothetical protein
MIIQLKRGTTAQAAAWVGAEGSLFVDLTAKLVYVHDGVTAGGSLVGGLSTAAVNQLIDDKLATFEVAVADVTGLTEALADTLKTADIGTKVATLTAGKIPVGEIPAIPTSGVTGLDDALTAKLDADEVGTSVASLVGGKVPAGQLPDPVAVPVKATGAELIAGTDDAKFATAAAMLALLTDIGFTKDGNGDWKLDAGVVAA